MKVGKSCSQGLGEGHMSLEGRDKGKSHLVVCTLVPQGLKQRFDSGSMIRVYIDPKVACQAKKEVEFLLL